METGSLLTGFLATCEGAEEAGKTSCTYVTAGYFLRNLSMFLPCLTQIITPAPLGSLRVQLVTGYSLRVGIAAGPA